jgi:hypothetical protein
MTTEQRALMNVLCERIQGEQDPKRFLALLEDLNELLEKTGTHPDWRKAPLSIGKKVEWTFRGLG